MWVLEKEIETEIEMESLGVGGHWWGKQRSLVRAAIMHESSIDRVKVQLTSGTRGGTPSRHRDRLRQRREDVLLPDGFDSRRADVRDVLLELLVHALGIHGVDPTHPDPGAQPLTAIALPPEGVALARQCHERELVLHGEGGVVPHVVGGEVSVGHAVGEDVEVLGPEVAVVVGGGGEGVQALARYDDLLQASPGFGEGGNVRADPSALVVVRRGRDGIAAEVAWRRRERAGRGGVGADCRQEERDDYYSSRCHGFESIAIRKRERMCGMAIVWRLLAGPRF
jgi:hypothetical protein